MKDIIETAVMIIGLALIVVLANVADSRRELRRILYLILVVMAGTYTSTYFDAQDTLHISITRASVAFALALGFSAVTLILMIPAVRRWLARWFPPRQLDVETGQMTGFDPDSMVHMIAMIYCVYLLSRTVLTFVVAGGLAGLAGDFQNITTGQLWSQLAIWILFAVVGVGLGARRSFPAMLRRLGLRAPTISELVTATVVAVGLFCIAIIVGIIWQELTPPDVFKQQNALNEELNASVSTMTLAFMLAFSAAVGEEIAFRGALQPVFGIWPTSILFASVHIQYALTPASLLIFVVALGLGWLRRKYNTTTSMVAHFLYDFGPVALVLLAQLAPAALRFIR